MYSLPYHCVVRTAAAAAVVFAYGISHISHLLLISDRVWLLSAYYDLHHSMFLLIVLYYYLLLSKIIRPSPQYTSPILPSHTPPHCIFQFSHTLPSYPHTRIPNINHFTNPTSSSPTANPRPAADTRPSQTTSTTRSRPSANGRATFVKTGTHWRGRRCWGWRRRSGLARRGRVGRIGLGMRLSE